MSSVTRASRKDQLALVRRELGESSKRVTALIDRLRGRPAIEDDDIRSEYASLAWDERMDQPEGHNEDSPYTSLRIQFRAAVFPVPDLISRAEEQLVLQAAQSANRRPVLEAFRQLPFVTHLDRFVQTDPFRMVDGLDGIIDLLADARKSNQSRVAKQKPARTKPKDTSAPGTHERDSQGRTSVKSYKTPLGRNIDRLRRDCGWSMNALSEHTHIDKKLILGHINKGNGAHPSTLKKYADAFARELERKVFVTELVS
jgi:hypothetical protein